MTHKPCVVCGTTNSKPLYPQLSVAECCGCGFIYADMEVEPAGIYTKEYFQGGAYPDYGRERQSLRKNFSKRLAYLRHHIPPGSKVFEIGSAFGFFLELAQEDYEASGIDISETAARIAREQVGVNVVAGDFLALPDPPQPECGLVCMWDAIEHLDRPDLFLEKARRWLVPGGLVAVTTGDVGSLPARIQGPRWRQISPPLHLHFFSIKTLSQLFQRLGFEVVHVSHPGLFRGYASTVELLFGKGALCNILTVGGRLNFEFYVNSFVILRVRTGHEVAGQNQPPRGA